MDGKNKAIFLDRDGVINVDCGYPHRIEDFELVEGAGKALKMAQQGGRKLFIVTNQGGIGLGYFTLEDMHAFHGHMAMVLKEEYGVGIDDISYCPHHPDAQTGEECVCRKPSPKMILDLAARHDIDRSRSAMIGDRITDMQAAEAAGVRGYHFTGGRLDTLMERVLAELDQEKEEDGA